MTKGITEYINENCDFLEDAGYDAIGASDIFEGFSHFVQGVWVGCQDAQLTLPPPIDNWRAFKKTLHFHGEGLR